MSFACRGGHPLSGIKIIFFRIGETLEYRWTRRRFDNIPVKLCNVAIGKSVVVQPPTTSVPFFWVLHAVVLGIFASLEKTHTFPFALPFDMLKIEARKSGLGAKQGHGPEGTRSRRLIGWLRFRTWSSGACRPRRNRRNVKSWSDVVNERIHSHLLYYFASCNILRGKDQLHLG